jgi:H+/Cl- antiporter ClcA/CBS domain-containing protein
MERQGNMKVKRGDFSSDQRFISLSLIALGIGTFCALVAVFLVKLISLFTNLFFFQNFSLQPSTPATNTLGLWVIVVPAIGGLIIGLMARFGSEKIRGHGIPEALEAILFGKSIMSPKVALLKPLSSAISIGSGGPFGAEGPIIMTGGAFGSLIGQSFHLTDSERKTLLVAGAAAGMSAIFATPVAAVLLAVELLLFEWRPRCLVPVAAASIVASTLRPYLLGSGPIFLLSTHVNVGSLGIAAACLVGLIAGLFATGTSGLLYKLEDAFQRLPFHWMWWPLIGGLVVGIGGYLQPRALGVGYDVIEDLLKGNIPAQIAMSLLLVKSLIWVVSLASGTSGGVLAPLLMMGCGLGVVESLFLPGDISPIYPLMSMAAVMGGMMRSPFTAVIFAFELTHNVDAVIPTLAATIVSYAVTVLLMKRSILTEKVARRGYDIFREYGVDPLEVTRVSEVMTKNVVTVPINTTLSVLMAECFGGHQKFRGYPVLDPDEKLTGILTASDVLEHRLHPSPSDLVSGEIAKSPVVTIYPYESCREAAERMASLNIGRLPVVDPDDPKHLIGIITRSDLLKPRLKHRESESVRVRIVGRKQTM